MIVRYLDTNDIFEAIITIKTVDMDEASQIRGQSRTIEGALFNICMQVEEFCKMLGRAV